MSERLLTGRFVRFVIDGGSVLGSDYTVTGSLCHTPNASNILLSSSRVIDDKIDVSGAPQCRDPV